MIVCRYRAVSTVMTHDHGSPWSSAPGRGYWCACRAAPHQDRSAPA